VSYCAEEIQDAAIKCRHCGEFLDASSRLRQKETPSNGISGSPISSSVFVWTAGVALIWWRPIRRALEDRTHDRDLALSWIVYLSTMESIRKITEYYKLAELNGVKGKRSKPDQRDNKHWKEPKGARLHGIRLDL